MKKAWDSKQLASVSAINYGYTQSASSEPVGPRFLRITDIQDERVDWAAVPYCKIAPEDAAKYKLASGDIVFARTGATTGKSFLVSAPPDAVFASYLIRLRLLDKNLLPEFVSFFFQTDGYWRSIKEGSAGSAQGGFNATKLGSLSIPIPPLPEQQRIVCILDEAFNAIAKAKTNAERNIQNAGAVFESHLESVFNQRSNGWVEKSVGDLVADGVLLKPFDGNHGEIHPKQSDYTESGVPFIMARDLQNGHVDTEHCIFISRKQADSLRVGFAKDGDVLISHKGTIGRSAIVKTDDDYIMLTPQVTSYRVRDTSKLFNRFIYYYFMSPGFQREMIAGAADGSTRAHIGITKQLTLRIRYPDLAQQKRIADALDVLGPETQRLATLYEQKLAALESLKKSILYNAYTGVL